jgi:hypothetical protein
VDHSFSLNSLISRSKPASSIRETSDDLVPALMATAEAAIIASGSVLFSHPRHAELQAISAQLDAAVLATPAASMAGLLAHVRALVDLVRDEPVGRWTKGMAEICARDIERLETARGVGESMRNR